MDGIAPEVRLRLQEEALRKVYDAVEEFQEALKGYPFQDIAEFRRLSASLNDFAMFGAWTPYDCETDEEGKDVRRS